MNITKHARVHRFHDYVAVSVGDADTEYLTPEIARKLAVALARYADDAEQALDLCANAEQLKTWATKTAASGFQGLDRDELRTAYKERAALMEA